MTRRRKRRSAVCLSAEADWKAVSFPATPRVAVVLRVSVGVAAVHQDGAADHRGVVEALHGELGPVLERETEEGVSTGGNHMIHKTAQCK